MQLTFRHQFLSPAQQPHYSFWTAYKVLLTSYNPSGYSMYVCPDRNNLA